jgi:hypothetical protein
LRVPQSWFARRLDPKGHQRLLQGAARGSERSVRCSAEYAPARWPIPELSHDDSGGAAQPQGFDPFAAQLRPSSGFPRRSRIKRTRQPQQSSRTSSTGRAGAPEQRGAHSRPDLHIRPTSDTVAAHIRAPAHECSAQDRQERHPSLPRPL